MFCKYASTNSASSSASMTTTLLLFVVVVVVVVVSLCRVDGASGVWESGGKVLSCVLFVGKNRARSPFVPVRVFAC